MWPVKWITDPVQVEALIKKWQGASAQIWGYSVSHSKLLIRIYWEQEPVDTFSLYLYFKGCNRVAFESSWKGVDFEVKKVEGKYGPEIVTNDQDHFFVHSLCGPFAYESDDFLHLEGHGA